VHLDLVVYGTRCLLLGEPYPLLVRLSEVGRAPPELAGQVVAEDFDETIGPGAVVLLGEEQQQARPPLVVGRAGAVVAQYLGAVADKARRMSSPGKWACRTGLTASS
jgi:hypothetical protein